MYKSIITLITVILVIISTLVSIDALYNHTGEPNHSFNRSFNVDADNDVNDTKGVRAAESTTIFVPADYDTIQAAINHSSSGYTIIVSPRDGTNVYNESIEINDCLSEIKLIANGAVVINCSESDQITVKGEGCTIQGFNITADGQCGSYPNYPNAGIRLCSDNNTVSNNYIYGTCEGIAIDNASYSTIRGNIFTNNVSLKGSDNIIYNNKFIGKNVTLGSENTYNITKTRGTNILGGPYLGGNYWSDYTGNDSDGDGIGDTAYSYDQLPLVVLKPDLVVTGIACGLVVVNTTNTISVTVTNVGATAPSFNLSLKADEELIEAKTVDSLSAGVTSTTIFTWRPTATGNHTLKAIADSDGAVAEFNEMNNEFEDEISVMMRVTVVIKDDAQNIHIQTLSLQEHESVLVATEIACEVLNLSFNSTEGLVTGIDGLDSPKIFLYDYSLEFWNETEISHKLEDGDCIGWGKANDLPAMLPDITVNELIIADGAAYPNITTEILVEVLNNGFAEASNVSVVFKANDVLIGDETITHINRTDTVNITFGWKPTQIGDYTLSVDVDPGNKISELNETNNYITKNVTVELPPPVVHVSSIVALQDMIDVSPAVVANHGWMTIYLDDDGIYEETLESIGLDHVKVISLTDKRNLSIISENKDVAISIKEADVAFGAGVDVISISNSSNLELRGFIVEVKKYNDNPLQNTRNIAIEDSNNITLRNLALPHQGTRGKNIHIRINNSRGCVISDNIMPHGDVGIQLLNADNNLITNNTIYFERILDDTSSIHLNGCNNTIYANNLFGPAKDYGNGNHWYSSHTINYTYNDSVFSNYTGNYWYNYEAEDENGDGIGDVPYNISGSARDYYPLMEPQGLSVDIIATEIIVPSMLYANRATTILASVESTGTYPLPVQIYVNLTANGEVTDTKTITMNNSEHKVVRFDWTPQNTGKYRMAIHVGIEERIEAVKETNVDNNNLSIDAVEVSSAPYNYSTNITSALAFLNESQHPLGSGSMIVGFSTSGWAALAITAAGEDPTSGRWKPYYSLIDYLRAEPKKSVVGMPPGANPSILDNVEDFARMVLVISAVGEDPTDFGDVNYLVMLKSYYDGEQFGYKTSVMDDALAILALVSCGDKDQRTKEMIKNATSYIKAEQNEDCGWSSFGVNSDANTTALVIQALIAAGEEKKSGVIIDALEYLGTAQEADGGFSDTITTSFAIQAIIAAGGNPSSFTRTGNSSIDYLLSLQQKDGSFKDTKNLSLYPSRTTAFAIPALCAIPYPIMQKGMRAEYELPDISVRDVKLEEDEICVNTSYTVIADVNSNGGIFAVNLSSDGVFIQSKVVNSVWHNSLSRVEFTWKPNRTGIYNLTVVADSNNRIAESNEKNNDATLEGQNVVLPDPYSSSGGGTFTGFFVKTTTEGSVSFDLSTAIDSDTVCTLAETGGNLNPGDIGNTTADDDVANDYIIIENTGSSYVDIAAYSDDNLFTGGSIETASNQDVKAVNNETNSANDINAVNWTELNVTGSRTSICEGLNWGDSADSIFIHIKLTVPDDASAKTYQNTVTVVAAEDTGTGNQANP